MANWRIGQYLIAAVCIWWLTIAPLQAETLGDRVASFPNWASRPSISDPRQDLAYPAWMEGTWHVTSTLTQMEAPLAPKIVTPGFAGNRQYLDRPLEFNVHFHPAQARLLGNLPFGALGKPPIIADRQFNSEQILKAYIGQDSPLRVRVDPGNPNQQATILPDGRQLLAVVTARGSQTLGDRDFIGSELVTQFFRTKPEIYLNGVETTTAYHWQSRDRVEAQQLTAVYLSPKDPDYFTAGDRPVALYRYNLRLDRLDALDSIQANRVGWQH